MLLWVSVIIRFIFITLPVMFSDCEASVIIIFLFITLPVMFFQLVGGFQLSCYYTSCGATNLLFIFPFNSSPEAVFSLASKMIGHRLVTKHTGPNGRPCDKVHVHVLVQCVCVQEGGREE